MYEAGKLAAECIDFTDCQLLLSVIRTPDDFKRILLENGLLGKSFWKIEDAVIFGVQRYMHGDANIFSGDLCWPEKELFSRIVADNVPLINVSSWKEYYQYRQLGLSNPIALLLSPVLTLYLVIRKHLLSQPCVKMEALTVHIVGVEREVDLIPLFSELNELLPISIRLVMVGRNISARIHNQKHLFGKLDILTYSGPYEQFLAEMELSNSNVTDFALALNAGIGVCSDWLPALRKMKKMGITFYATDFCEEAVNFSESFLASHKIGHVADLYENPFHSPIKAFLDVSPSQPSEVAPPNVAFSNRCIYSVQWLR